MLDRIRADGFWLLDAVDEPINKLRSAARARAIAAGVPRLAERCVELAPELGVIICHGKVYAAGAQPLREAGVVLLHDEPCPSRSGTGAPPSSPGFGKRSNTLSKCDAPTCMQRPTHQRLGERNNSTHLGVVNAAACLELLVGVRPLGVELGR